MNIFVDRNLQKRTDFIVAVKGSSAAVGDDLPETNTAKIQVTIGTMPSGDLGSMRKLATIGAVFAESTSALWMKRTLVKRCQLPSLLLDVLLGQ